jgi:hypothetical protein
MSTIAESRWQPVVLIVNKRLECKCGALATFVSGKIATNPDDYNVLNDVDVWCQDCFEKAQEEQQ